MKEKLRKRGWFLALMIASVPLTSHAADICDASTIEMKRCVAKALSDDKELLPGCHVADVVNGTKIKDRTDLCALECNLHRDTFPSKYSSPQECADQDGPISSGSTH
jgi:hypothetical protein